MRIGQLASAAGVSLETIRFYESKGLLPPAQRLPNNYRVYSEKHLARLHFIRHCRLLDIGLDDIHRLISLDTSDAQQAQCLHELINKHVKAVSERIAELQLLRENLLDLSARCNGHHSSGHCGIMESLEAYSQEGGCCSEFMNIKHSK